MFYWKSANPIGSPTDFYSPIEIDLASVHSSANGSFLFLILALKYDTVVGFELQSLRVSAKTIRLFL